MTIAKGDQRRLLLVSTNVLSALLFFWLPSLTAQVSPAEIKNPTLKALEQKYLSNLTALHQAISEIAFPFKLSLNRQVGLDLKEQTGADQRGLEFVMFHERPILKITANYNAAFNANTLTPNQRADRVLGDVILPVLRLLPRHFNQNDPFDGFGFEIGYHVRRSNPAYDYEGKENLVIVFDKQPALQYAELKEGPAQQEILNRSEIFLNGEPLGLALNSKTPIEAEPVVSRPASKAVQAAQAKSTIPLPPSAADVDALRKKYQAELDTLNREGKEKYYFVDYAPSTFVLVRDQLAFQATLRNPEPFDKDSTSIYRRAARAFDLFLAPRLRWILSKLPETGEFSALDISVINELASAKSEKSSEAIEFIFPIKEARQFAASEITNQHLIDKSIVLVNGVRIALNLAQVE